ncbi:MAG TPA: PTS glucose/sucrose transporter subunit IIB [Luteimicrobium sp.]|nr:PTS glucose/sucrose transporter subunit IIB [Luteimicrobium sp.]
MRPARTASSCRGGSCRSSSAPRSTCSPASSKTSCDHPPPQPDQAQKPDSTEKEHQMSKAEQILAGLGGDDNIVDLEPCITRLRVEVEDPARVNEAGLKAAGAIAVVQSGKVVQVIVGPEADTLASDIEDLR